jgi:hypothetical protein
MGGGSVNDSSRDKRDQVKEPTGPLEAGDQQASLEAIGKVIAEAEKELRDGKVDPELLKALGMTQTQFAAFVEKYTQRIGEVKKMSGETAKPTGTVIGSAVIPGNTRQQAGRGVDGGMDGVRGSEKLSTDEVRKLYEQRAKTVSAEYRKQVEAYFRAISEASPTKDAPAKDAPKEPAKEK